MYAKTLLFCVCIFVCQGIVQAQDNLVDLFSGDFRYEVPVMRVPSLDGPGVPLSLKYHSGIQVHQKASWVGLGWDLEVGEIRRNVHGVPDDWKNVTQTTRIYKRQGGGYVLHKEYPQQMYGPVYYKDFGNWSAATPDREMDVYVSNTSGSGFTYPNYDDYTVTVPEIRGNIRPFLFEKGTLVSKDIQTDAGKNPVYFDAPNHERNSSLISTQNFATSINASGTFITGPGTCKPFTKSPQFLFENEFGSVDVDPNSGVFSGNLNPNGTAKSNRQIVYYTGNQYRTNTGLSDFIKYAGFALSATDKDDDIVGFKITDEAGYTYHFSLPVYVTYHQSFNIEMPQFNVPNADNLKITATTKAISDNSSGKPYVVAWKLTAITGPDFVDAAPLNSIGAEDDGYWVQYEYGKWSPAFAWQSPYYDCTHHFGENEEWQRQLQEKYPQTWNLWVGASFPDYSDEGNISKGSTELYFLDKIKTRTHTAFFVKDVRLDEYSKVQGLPVSGSTPNLYLRRIILLNNTDAALFTSSAPMTNPKSSSFTINTTLAQGVVHEQKYQAIKATIDPKTLAAVEFVYDYQLAPNYYNNIDAAVGNGFSLTSTSFTFPTGYTSDNFTYEKYTAGATPGGSTGKLTLKSVKTLGYTNAQVTPTYDFTYGYANTGAPKNYAFHPFKKDFWGYYKDFSSSNPASLYAEYQTPSSKNQVDAWSLTRVRTPLGAFFDIEYESDEYTQTGRDGAPVRIFGGKFTWNNVNNKDIGTFVFDDTGLYDLLSTPSEIDKVSFGYPINCSYSAPYYSAPDQASFNFFVSGHGGLNKADYDATSITSVVKSTNGSGQTLIGTPAIPITLFVDCGAGPDGLSSTTNGHNKDAATASVRLKRAYGGGVRVKSISVKELDNSTGATVLNYKTEYIYTNDGVATGTSSGVASLEPDRFTPPFLNGRPKVNYLYDPHSFSPKVGYSKVTVQSKKLDLNNLNSPTENTDRYTETEFFNFNDYPFGNRGISTLVHDNTYPSSLSNYTSYFDCLQSSNFNFQGCQNQLQLLSGVGYAFHLWSLSLDNGFIAKDRSRTLVGKVKSIVARDKNNVPIQSTENKFERKNSMTEVFHQRYHSTTPVVYDPSYLYQNSSIVQTNVVLNNTLIGGFSPFNSPNAKGRLTALHSNLYHKKHEESEYLAKQISTQNDIKTVTEYLAFDPITGNATQVRTTDPSTGSVTEKIIEYAYTDPAYVAMGPKSVDATYSNQLGLVSLEKTLRDNVLIGGTRTTFDKNLLTRKFNTGTLAYESVSTARDWKPKKTFVFNGNVTPTSWKEVNEFTLFSPRGAVLEQKTPATSTSAGTVARYSAMKLGYDDRFATTEVSDSKYTESTFSGAEDYNSTTGYFGGEVKLGTNATVNTSAPYIHTGTKSLKISPNGNGFVYKIAATELNLARTYVARVWVYNNGNSSAGLKYQFLNSSNAVIKEDVVNLNSSTAFSANQNGYTYAKKDGWVLLTLQVTLPASLTGLNFVLSCVNTSTTTDAYFDDLRLHPINSSMKNYIYDVQSERITQVLDENGFYQTIEYNEIGKIKKIWQETLDGVKLVTETNLNYYRISAPTVQY